MLKAPQNFFDVQFFKFSEKKMSKTNLLGLDKYQKELSHEFWGAYPKLCIRCRQIHGSIMAPQVQ